MDLQLLPKALGFLILLIIGVTGNVFIIIRFSYIRISEKKLQPINLILTVLALVNVLVIISRVIPQSLSALGVENLLGDTACKLVIFTYNVNRAMSICVTSLLSCYQCVIIAPKTNVWIYFKHRITQNASRFILFFWVINLSMYSYFFLNASARRNQTTSPYSLHLVYCDVDFLNYILYIVNGTCHVLRDFIFVVFMAMASGYIVFTLIRHERSVRCIRRSDMFHSTSVEYRASKAVIMLVVLYVLLYGMDNAMWIYIFTLSDVSTSMNEVRIFFASSYSSLSPIVIIITNTKLKQNLLSYKRNKILCSVHWKDYGN
ncbi:hypothetical protein GDO86_003263, partial [Hymenochirus boettgeri]